MTYEYFDTENGLNSPEEYTLIFKAELSEYSSLSEFGYACAKTGYDYINERIKSHSPEYKPYPWEKYLEEFITKPTPISFSCFLQMRKNSLFGVENTQPVLKETDIDFAMVFQNEWNDQLFVATLTDSYIGYWWQTDA